MAGRLPLLQWSRQVPISGELAENAAMIESYSGWLVESHFPKPLIHADNGAAIPPEAANFLKANLKNLTATSIGADIHYFQEDNPIGVVAALSDWLNTRG